MTTDALGTAGGVVSAQDHRLAISSLLMPLSTGALDTRTGVFPGPGWSTIITGTSATGTMTVNVGVFQSATARSSAGGAYLGPTQEAAITVNIATAPASNSRIDVVYVKQQDADATVLTPDGTTTPIVGVVTGTAAASPAKPGLPIGALELGTVTVAAGATSTAGAGVTIANTARSAVAAGGIAPIRSGDSAAGAYVGQYRDHPTSGLQRWDGSTWNPYATASSVASSQAALTAGSGWAGFATYYFPRYLLSAEGQVTLRGMFSRTGANVALPIGGGTGINLGTLPAAIMPANSISPIAYAGLGPSAQTYPVRLYVAGGTTALQVIGMDSGSGTFYQNTGYVNLDGVSWWLG